MISLKVRRSRGSTRIPVRIAIGVALLGLPLSVAAQQRVVRVPDDVESAAVMAVPVDPATRVVVARPPAQIGRAALEALGLTREQLATERAATYSPTHLEDEAGRLSVFYASLVKQGERWIFWSDDLPKGVVNSSPEVQMTLETERDARYLVDFALVSGEHEFSVVIGEARMSQTPNDGHIAVVVTGTGREQTIRVLSSGDELTQARHFTLFNVIVTPLR